MKWIAALVLCVLLGGAASAEIGPNSGGTLIVHATPLTIYSFGTDYCGLSGLEDCDDANVTLPAGTTQYVIWIVAAFPDGSSPRLKGVTFGIDYDPDLVTIVPNSLSGCGALEVPTQPPVLCPTWPEPGSGNGITWDEAQTSQLVDVYWFAVYGSGGQFRVTPHDCHETTFGDDSIPSVYDPVEGFGALGFGMDPGLLPCPPPAGACCVDFGQGLVCRTTTQEVCLREGGEYEGDLVACEPDLCLEGPDGACCLLDGACELLTEDECPGDWLGTDIDCDPNPCPTPTRRTTWGWIKGTHR